MKSGSRNEFVASVITLALIMGSCTAPALAGCRHHHHRVLSHYGWPDRFAQVSSYWRPQGYGCGPFADNADGWDIGFGGRCHFPAY